MSRKEVYQQYYDLGRLIGKHGVDNNLNFIDLHVRVKERCVDTRDPDHTAYGSIKEKPGQKNYVREGIGNVAISLSNRLSKGRAQILKFYTQEHIDCGARKAKVTTFRLLWGVFNKPGIGKFIYHGLEELRIIANTFDFAYGIQRYLAAQQIKRGINDALKENMQNALIKRASSATDSSWPFYFIDKWGQSKHKASSY